MVLLSNMSENMRIIDSSQLADFTRPESTEDDHVTLVLLQPLNTKEMFDRCRTNTPDVIRNQYGEACGTTNVETLNLDPLAAAWRKAVKEVAPISKITFDITLPQMPREQEEGRQSLIHWDVDPPRRGGFCVRSPAVMRLVAALATATRMRARGEVSFKLICDRMRLPREAAMERLEKQLETLAQHEQDK